VGGGEKSLLRTCEDGFRRVKSGCGGTRGPVGPGGWRRLGEKESGDPLVYWNAVEKPLS